MRLIVFGLNPDGGITKAGEMNVSPSRLADNKFIVPTDPGKLIPDDGDNGNKNGYLLLEITACQANKYFNQ